MSDENTMNDMKSENYHIQIDETVDGDFEYTLYSNKDTIILEGKGFESKEQIIEDLSEINEALSSIFG